MEGEVTYFQNQTLAHTLCLLKSLWSRSSLKVAVRVTERALISMGIVNMCILDVHAGVVVALFFCHSWLPSIGSMDSMGCCVLKC